MKNPLSQYRDKEHYPAENQISKLREWLLRDQWSLQEASFLITGLFPNFSSLYKDVNFVISSEKFNRFEADGYLKQLENYLSYFQYSWEVSRNRLDASPTSWLLWAQENNLDIPWVGWVETATIFEEIIQSDLQEEALHSLLNDEVEKLNSEDPYLRHKLSEYLKYDNWEVDFGLLLLCDLSPDSVVINQDSEGRYSLDSYIELGTIRKKTSFTDSSLNEMADESAQLVTVLRDPNAELSEEKVKAIHARIEFIEYLFDSEWFSEWDDIRTTYEERYNEIRSIWNSAAHTDNLYPISHYLEWAESKGITPNWITWAENKDLLPSSKNKPKSIQAKREKHLESWLKSDHNKDCTLHGKKWRSPHTRDQLWDLLYQDNPTFFGKNSGSTNDFFTAQHLINFSLGRGKNDHK